MKTININYNYFYSIAVVMRASGCEVPDYMFSMKKHDKRERKKLERVAPKRDSISTSLKKPKKQKKITRYILILLLIFYNQ